MEYKSEFILISHLAQKAGLHHDLRFQRPHMKTWNSFATKKEIPPAQGKRIILWKTTFHSESDAKLTGRIPSGEYGAGILTKVDGGEAIIKKYTDYHMIVEFKGKILKGTYHFFHPRGTGPTGKKYADNAFMFFRGRDTEVKEQIKLSENALTIATARYFMENENWRSFSRRVASAPAEIEKDKELYKEKFSEMVYEMDFLGGGRILRNSGRAKGSMLNCFHLPCGDSIEEIGDFIKESLILWSEGGGVGTSFSQLRPKGDLIKGKGGASTGPVSFIEAANAVSLTIESGGARRAAALGSLSVSHPDIFDFIDAKIVHGKISNFNISVEITNHFIDCVEKNSDWALEFNNKPYRTVKAREIWDKIVENMIKHAEPGILNMDNVTENNSWYFAPVTGVNPCVTGDTLIAVADGRGQVPIKQLAEEGKDVPVYCIDLISKKQAIRMGRNPRLTGVSKKVYKIILDDGSSVRATENHKFILRNGDKVEVRDLKIGDSLVPFNKNQSKNGKMYWTIQPVSNKQREIAEHREIATFCYGSRDSNFIPHHKNGNSLDNNPENLEWLTIGEHNLVEPTISNRCAELNGMFGKHHSKDTKEEISRKIKDLYENNEEYKTKCKISKENPSQETRLKISIAKTKEKETVKAECKQCHTIFKKEIIKGSTIKQSFCNQKCSAIFTLENHVAKEKSKETLKKISESSKKFANSEEGKVAKKNAVRICNLNKALRCGNIALSLDLDISRENWNNNKDVLKNNGIKTFISSDFIDKKWHGNWNSFIEESINFNHRIVSIEENGFEDVYNLTVDDYHNYAIVTNANSKTRFKKYDKVTGIYIANCGEATLSPHESCDLGSLVLPHFVDNNGNTNWPKLKETIFLSVRFLDNVLDVNKYVITKIKDVSHDGRRIGVGIMGLAEYLFKKKIKYGSEESLLQIQELMSFIRDNCYLASSQLAKEKGPFPKFDRDLYLASRFVKTLPKEIQTEIYNNGIRNVTLMAIAPTGTISLLPEVSSGIEPLFSKSFIRRDRAGNRVYIHPLYEKLIIEDHKVPKWLVDAHDLTPSEHFLVQRTVQKFTDGSVSKTINLPKGTTKEQLSDLLLHNIKYLKGVTVYVDGSRSGQILNRMSDSQVIVYLKKNGKLASHSLSESDVECNVCSKAKEYKHREYEDIKKEIINDLLKKGGN